MRHQVAAATIVHLSVTSIPIRAKLEGVRHSVNKCLNRLSRALGNERPAHETPCLAVNCCNQITFVFLDPTKVCNSSSSVTSDVTGLGGCFGSESTCFFTQRPTDCELTCSIRAALRWLIPSATSRSALWRIWGLCAIDFGFGVVLRPHFLH